MALNNWLSKCPITVKGTLLATSVTDFVMLMVGSNFPTEIFSTESGCLASGADIRFTTDVDGLVEISRDVVAVDKATRILSVYVKVPSITAGANSTIYCWWNNPGANEPGGGSPSQKELVWSTFYGVLHFNTMTTAWKGIKDVSTSWNSCTAIGTPLTTTGHAPGLKAALLSTTFGITLHELVSFAGLTNDYMFWMYQPTAVAGNIATGTNGIPMGFLSAGQFGWGWGGAATQGNVLTGGVWHHVIMRNVAGSCNIYVDGVLNLTGGATGSASNFANIGTGKATSPVWHLSEFRMTRNNSIPLANIPAMYICEKNPELFTTPGTVSTVSASYTLELTGLHAGSEIRIYKSSDMSELAGVEDSLTTYTWDFVVTGTLTVDIVIMHLNYNYIRMNNIVLSTGNVTIPIQQVFDRNYVNP